MFLVTAIEGAERAAIEGNEFCVEFLPEAKHLRDTLAKSDNAKILREVCQEVTHRELGVRIAITEGAKSDHAPLTKEEEERLKKQELRAAAEQNPLVQQVMRKFRGEILDVRRVESE